MSEGAHLISSLASDGIKELMETRPRPDTLKLMEESVFALFVDVMGVQRELTRGDVTRTVVERRCREVFEQFHGDLFDTINLSFPMIASGGSIEEPSFIAEFSDAAYVVGRSLATVAAAGLSLMRKALRHRYPLRGGIGIGSFSHETSGVRTIRTGQVWSTSSFFGSSVVTAYQAERSIALGLRIFVHEAAAEAAKAESTCLVLPDDEPAGPATHELRVWRSVEADAALRHLSEFRDAQQLTERALAHYAATAAAYKRFASIEDDLPFATPAMWLF